MSVTLTAQAGLGPSNVGPALFFPLTGVAEKQGEVIPLTGSMTYTVDLAMMPTAGAQALLVSVDRNDADEMPATAGVVVTLTPGGALPILMPGGFVMLASPGTTAGVTGLTLTSTANARVRVSGIG